MDLKRMSSLEEEQELLYQRENEIRNSELAFEGRALALTRKQKSVELRRLLNERI